MLRHWASSKARKQIEADLPKVFPRIWRYALTLTGRRDRADDLAQTACLRAFERVAQFEPGTQLDRWMFRITHNLWVSEIRKETVRRGGGLVSIEEAEIVDPRKSAEDALAGREVLMAVMRLPEAQRQTVYLVYVEGYSYKDAAMILNVPLGTVMSRLATARAALGARFREKAGDRNAG